jgi:LPS O-antigen subunit length determinant protein (WzzB/FepE family)
MRDWIRVAARLYPRSWRERYGIEFDALLDDADTGPREFVDVIRGALTMQLRTVTSWKIAAATALGGAIAACAISFALPGRYVSTAVIRTGATQFAEQRTQEILSRGSLAEIIQRPSLHLYARERYRIPMEDIIQQMRDRDIRVQQVGTELRISFAYPDPVKAQAVTRALTTRFTESEQVFNRYRTFAWQQIWPDSPSPSGADFEVLEASSLPEKSIAPNRLAFLAAGLGVGLIAGMLAAATMRRPQWARRIAVFAVAGLVAGAVVSFLLPDAYISTAVMRFSPPIVPENPTAPPPPVSPAEQLQRMQQKILSRDSLAGIIERPAVNLYPQLRAKEPLEDVVAYMRDHLTIRPAGAYAFEISFTHPDPRTAQAVVRELVTGFVEQNLTAAMARTEHLKEDDPVRRIEERRLGAHLEVLDPASLPQAPISPNRTVVSGIGVALGLMIGALSVRWRPRPVPESC